MTMTAVVTEVNPQSLLVRDVSNDQEVLVNTRNSRRFRVGDRVRITFSGQMTSSIPPQISATSIRRIGGGFRPNLSQMRGIVLQIGRDFVLIWDIFENRLVYVEYPNGQRLRAGQFVTVRYDTITLDTPPRIVAISIN